MSDVIKIKSAAKKPGPSGVEQARIYAQSQRERFKFDASKIVQAKNVYVAWLDLMGAGHIMSVSMEKSANFLVRLHMAVDQAVSDAKGAVLALPINDGVFLTSEDQATIKIVVRKIMMDLSCFFISTPDVQNRFLLRGAIAYGPVYRGSDMLAGLSLKKKALHSNTLDRVAFGPAIIQAYGAETLAPPYGIAVHESARSFAPAGSKPFRLTHWLWWATEDGLPQPSGAAPLKQIKEALKVELHSYFAWMDRTSLLQGLKPEKIASWKQAVDQYFELG